MVENSLEQALRNFHRCFYEKGVLDHNFENVKRSEAQGNPRFLIEVVTEFINTVDVFMQETTGLMNEPELDYETLNSHLHRLQGRSASIGGCRMAAACRDVRQAIDAGDKARCLETFKLVKQEYQILCNIFQTERYVLACVNQMNGA